MIVRRIAILGFEDEPVFQQNLTVAFLNRGVDVVEREKIEELVQEQQMVDQKFVDLSDRDKAVALGRLLDVDALVLGGVTHDKYSALTADQYAQGWGYSGQATLQAPVPRMYVTSEIGATWRIVSASSGEVIGVGNRIMSTLERAKKENLNNLSQSQLIRLLCEQIVEDTFATESGTRDFPVDLETMGE